MIVPFVPGMLRTETYTALAEYAEFRPLAAGDETAYWRLLAAEWQRPGDLTVVEQDIVPHPGVLDEMAACPREWCVSPYLTANRQLCDRGLGCTKFSAALKTRLPDTIQLAGQIATVGLPLRSWRRLDSNIAAVLGHAGVAPHQHPPSRHLHDYD